MSQLIKLRDHEIRCTLCHFVDYDIMLNQEVQDNLTSAGFGNGIQTNNQVTKDELVRMLGATVELIDDL